MCCFSHCFLQKMSRCSLNHKSSPHAISLTHHSPLHKDMSGLANDRSDAAASATRYRRHDAVIHAIPFLPAGHIFRRQSCQAVAPYIRKIIWLEEDLQSNSIVSHGSSLPRHACEQSHVSTGGCLNVALTSPAAWGVMLWWVRLQGAQLSTLRCHNADDSMVNIVISSGALAKIRHFDISSNRSMTSEALRHCLSIWPLESCSLSSVSALTSTTTAGIFSPLRCLRRLSLARCPLVEAATLANILVELRESMLEILDVSCTSFMDSCVTSHSCSLPSLLELNLSHCAVTTKIVEDISSPCLSSRFPSLLTLKLHRCFTFGTRHCEDSDGNVPLARIPAKLSSLDLSGTSVDDACITSMLTPGGECLHTVRLGHCYNLTEIGIAGVTAFPQLRLLDLTAASFAACEGRVALPLIARCLPLLEKLYLSECTGIDEGVLSQAVGDLLLRPPRNEINATGVSVLDLQDCSGVVDTMFGTHAWTENTSSIRPFELTLTRGGQHVNAVMLESIGHYVLPFISSLNVAECSLVTDEAILRLFSASVLPHCPQLSLISLNLSQCFVSDAALATIGGSSASVSLRHLYLTDNHNISNKGAVVVGSLLASLESLHLGGTRVTDDGLAALHPLARSLKTLSLNGCIGVTDVGLLELSAFTSLEYLDLTNCCGLKDSCGRALSTLGSLGTLLLAGCVLLSTECLSLMTASPLAATALHTLSLCRCPTISNDVTNCLGRMRSLEELDVSGTQVSIDALRMLTRTLPLLHRLTPSL